MRFKKLFFFFKVLFAYDFGKGRNIKPFYISASPLSYLAHDYHVFVLVEIEKKRYVLRLHHCTKTEQQTTKNSQAKKIKLLDKKEIA